MKPHAEYRGWRSTKLWLAVFTQLLLSGAYAFMGFPQMLFGEFGMLLLGSATIFTGPALLENLKRLRSPAPDAPPAPPAA